MRSGLPLVLCAWFLACADLGGEPPQSGPRDYILTGTKPGILHLIDAEAREVVASHTIPDANSYLATIVPSPDGKIAYALVNGLQSIVGIDMDTGEQVFRADLARPGMRVRCFFGFDVTPDGAELIAYELPVRIHPGEYEVLEPRFSVYRTDAGLDAEPVRQFPAPRRVHMVMVSQREDAFYALGFDMYKYDRQTGALLETIGVRNWDRPNHSIPDLLSFWPQWGQADVFSTPVFSTLENVDPNDPAAARTGLLTLDLNTGEFQVDDFEATSVLIFSSVISPTRPQEAFGVYTQLSKIDRAANRLVNRVDLDHTYYTVNVSSDGNEVYVGGTMCDIAVYDASTLQKKDTVELPDCGDMGIASVRIIRR